MKFSPVLFVGVLASCASEPGPVVPKTRVEKQMIGLLEKFDRYDLDGSGELDTRELAAAQKSTGHLASEIIEFYDEDRDEKISLREAQKGYSRNDEAEEKARR